MSREALSTKRLSPLALVIIVVVLLSAAMLALKNSFLPKKEIAPVSLNEATTRLSNNPTNDELLKKVAGHLLVNAAEAPQIAVVQDATALRAQSPYFYKDAETGDRVLVWADKAVLYSISRDLILSVLPVSFSSTTPVTTASSTSSTQRERVTIEVRNGSGVAGRAKTEVKELQDKGFTVLPATDAKASYAETLVINASGSLLPETMQTLLQMTGGKTAPLPPIEGKTKADILIIIGTSSPRSL